MGDRHTLYAVNIDTVGAGDVLIDQLENFGLNPNTVKALGHAGGAVDPTFVSVNQQSPAINFSTSMLATVLAKCGIAGLKITSDVDELGAQFFFQKMDELGTRATGANHIKVTMAKGLLIPTTLSANQGGNAMLSVEAHAVYDESVDPLVIATSQELPAAGSVSELFTVGPVSINGAALNDVVGININFGVNLLIDPTDGLVWPRWLNINTRQPVITIDCRDVAQLGTLGLLGAAQDANDSIIYLRKRSEGAALVADDVAEHISFSIDEAHIDVVSIGGAVPLGCQVRIRPTYDDTNAIMAINTATTIT